MACLVRNFITDNQPLLISALEGLLRPIFAVGHASSEVFRKVPLKKKRTFLKAVFQPIERRISAAKLTSHFLATIRQKQVDRNQEKPRDTYRHEITSSYSR